MNTQSSDLLNTPLTPKTPKFLAQGQDLSKLLILGLISLFMCLILPLSLLAPVPLAMAFLLFGRLKGFLLCGATAFLLVLLNLVFKSTGTTASQVLGEALVVYVVAVFYALAVVEIIFSKREPSFGMLTNGLFLLLFLAAIMALILNALDFSFIDYSKEQMALVANKFKTENAELLASGGEETRELLSYLENPGKIIQWIPVFVFNGLFLGLWMTLFVVLKNAPLWNRGGSITEKNRGIYPYTLDDLKFFKSASFMIYPLILALGLYLGADYGPPHSEAVAESLIYCIGLFFFFQGFGIFLDFLTYLKIFGIMRSLFLFGALWLAWKYLALLGLINTWFDIRNLFKTDLNKEGE